MSMTENERNIWADAYRLMNENVGSAIGSIKTKADEEAFWSQFMDKANDLAEKHGCTDFLVSIIAAISDEIERQFYHTHPAGAARG